MSSFKHSYIILTIIMMLMLMYMWHPCWTSSSQSLTSTQQTESIGTGENVQQRKDLIYIYDWPDAIINSWPDKNATFLDEFTPDFYRNHGAGKLLNQSTGLYRTFQYGLFLLFYYRLLQSPLRTHDPNMATSFFIPYDIGIDASYNKDGKLRRTNCPRSDEVSRLLFASPYFSKRGGHDHFLLHSINQPMRFFNNQPACYDFLTRICTNCTKLSIDSYPKGYDRTSYMPNWHSIPFPSNYHWSSFVTHPPWADFSRPRPYAVSYIGSMSSHLKKSRTLREILRRECRESEYRYAGLCRWYDLSHHGSSADALSPNHTSQSNMWRAAEDSTFCITPPGDFPTRKGFFDSLLAGCIPVVFAPLSAHRQWPWHLGLSSTFAVTVYVSGQRVLDQSLNTVQYLIDKHLFEKDEVYMKRRAIADLAFGLQYSMPERGMNNTEFSRNDAFDITIENILQLHRVAERRWEQSIEIGDHIDRGLVPYDISFSYNIHKNDIR